MMSLASVLGFGIWSSLIEGQLYSGCIKSCNTDRHNNWQEVPLASACIKVTDGSHFSPTPRRHGRPIANVKDLRPSFVDILSCTKIAEEDFQELVRNGCDVQRHDVLLSKDGTIGRVVVYEQDEPLVALSSIAILRPGKALDPFFLGQTLQSSQVTKQIGILAGGSALHRLVLRDINRISIPLPSLAEQRRIAAVLDTVDEAIAKTEAMIAKLKQVRAGLLHDLLTRGLDEHGQLRDPIAHPEQFRDSPLGQIPKEWEVLPLERVAEVDRGKFTHRPRNDPAFYGGHFPFIQTGDVALAAGETITEASQSLNDRGASVSSGH
jgi:type I restriction enzyme S subunit